MTTHEFSLASVKWQITAHYEVDLFDTLGVLDELVKAGCSGEDLKEAKKHLWADEHLSGLVYSNLDKRESIIIIPRLSSSAKYYSALCRAQMNAIQHISEGLDIDTDSEDICKAMEELSQRVFKHTRRLFSIGTLS